MKKILLINGANLNRIGARDPALYGGKGLDYIVDKVKEYGKSLDIQVDDFQSNHEGVIVDKIQEAEGGLRRHHHQPRPLHSVQPRHSCHPGLGEHPLRGGPPGQHLQDRRTLHPRQELHRRDLRIRHQLLSPGHRRPPSHLSRRLILRKT